MKYTESTENKTDTARIIDSAKSILNNKKPSIVSLKSSQDELTTIVKQFTGFDAFDNKKDETYVNETLAQASSLLNTLKAKISTWKVKDIATPPKIEPVISGDVDNTAKPSPAINFLPKGKVKDIAAPPQMEPAIGHEQPKKSGADQKTTRPKGI